MTLADDAPKVSILGAIVALGIGCLVLVLLAEVLLRFVYPKWHEFSSSNFLAIENVPGYGPVAKGKPGFDGYFAQNNGDFRVHIQVNDFGLRNSEPIDAANDRVWIVGDSMTFGWGVEQDEMYSSRIAELSGVPTYNVASPGTDVCGYQALIARMPGTFKPKAVVIGLILENDILVYDCETAAVASADKIFDSGYVLNPFSLSSWKRHLTVYSALYNFFAVSVKRVGGFEALLRMVGLINPSQHKAHSTSDEAINSAAKTVAYELARLRAILPAHTPLAILMVPSRFEIRDNDPYWIRLRLAVTKALAAADITTLDPLTAFQKAGFEDTHFRHDGHWSTLGHELAATAVVDWLQRRTPE